MKILALESSALAASAALCDDGKCVGVYLQNCGLTHSETLLPMAENLLRGCGWKLSDVDLIAVAHGPGSFTGLRIGAAVVNTLASELNIPLYNHKGEKVQIIIPDYGRPANITPPKK